MADISGFRHHMRWTSKQTLPDDVPKLLKLLATLPGTEVSKGLNFSSNLLQSYSPPCIPIQQPARVDQTVLAIVEDFGLDDSHIVKEEWKSVARIIDRFLNILFCKFVSFL